MSHSVTPFRLRWVSRRTPKERPPTAHLAPWRRRWWAERRPATNRSGSRDEPAHPAASVVATKRAHSPPLAANSALILPHPSGAASGLVAALADRVYRVRTLTGSPALGAVWSFVSFMSGTCCCRSRATARHSGPTAAGDYVAPTSVWILGFTLAGLTSGVCYWALRRRESAQAAATTQ
jgi:hypothetical protein